MADIHDILSPVAPMLRVRPELQDFCRFGGSWRASQPREDAGWAAFHIVTRGSCSLERPGAPPVHLEAGDVVLLPHGDGHVVYGQAHDRTTEFRDINVTYRAHIRFKHTEGRDVDTELVCGRLHLESSTENLLMRALPQMIVLRLGGMQRFAMLVSIIQEELKGEKPGSASIAQDLASALFVLLLRHHLELEPPIQGLLALLAARETARAVAAILREPARQWHLHELASTAAVSRATLVRAFRRIGGMPPQTFVTEIRLTLARNRLTHTSDALATTAAETGYQSEAALSRAFLTRFGIRPGAARLEAGSAVATVEPGR